MFGTEEGLEPDDLPCSRNARSQTPLVRANGTSRRVNGWTAEKAARSGRSSKGPAISQPYLFYWFSLTKYTGQIKRTNHRQRESDEPGYPPTQFAMAHACVLQCGIKTDEAPIGGLHSSVVPPSTTCRLICTRFEPTRRGRVL